MKKLCILLLLFSSILVQSQNWEIAVPGERYLYKHTTAQQINLYQGYQFDSLISIQNQSLHYRLSRNLVINHNLPNCLNFNSTSFGKEILIEPNRQIIITSSNDSIVFPRFFKPNPANHIIYNDSNGVKLRATFISYDTLSYRGQLDSVVYVKIRHLDSLNQFIQNGYLDTLIFSKNNGLLRTLNWDDFPSANGNRWIRRELGALTKGEIYDYQPGDEFHILTYRYNAMNPPSYRNIKIIARIDSGLPNKISYIRELKSEYTINDFNYSPPRSTTYITISVDTITYTNLDQLYGGLPNQLEPNSNFYTIEFGPRWGTGLPTYQISNPPTYDTNNCWTNYYGQALMEYEVIKGIGLLEYLNTFGQGGSSHYERLIYYKKGNKTWGTPHIITGIESKENEQNSSFFPNPSAGIIQLDNLDSRGKLNIRIYDVKGVLMKSFQSYQQQRLDLSELSNGMYFIEIIGEDFQFSEKLIIQKP